MQASQAIGDVIDLIACLCQSIDDKFSNLDFVFDQ